MESNQLVSIIVPVYNAEKYLSKCVSSLLNQSYENIEVVIINDGSKDNSSKICHQIEQRDQRVKVYDIPNGGVSNARNFALRKINGELCMFVDADDYIDLDMVKKMVLALNKYGVNIVTCADTIGKLGSQPEQIIMVDDYDFQDTYSHPIARGALYRTKILSGLHFDDNLYVGEDSLFFSQAMNRCEKIVHLNEILYNYIVYSESALHGKYDDKKFTEVISWKKIVDEFSNRPQKMIDNCRIGYARRCYRGLLRADDDFDKNKKKFMLSVVRSTKNPTKRITERYNYRLISIFGLPYLKIYRRLRGTSNL